MNSFRGSVLLAALSAFLGGCISHPVKFDIARIAQLQTKWLEQEDRGTRRREWIKYPATAPTLREFGALPKIDQARSFFACIREILSHHPNLTFTFTAEDEVGSGNRATVTVIEHQHTSGGVIGPIRYSFVLERIEKRWAYVSGGSERVHADMQLMLLER